MSPDLGPRDNGDMVKVLNEEIERQGMFSVPFVHSRSRHVTTASRLWRVAQGLRDEVARSKDDNSKLE